MVPTPKRLNSSASQSIFDRVHRSQGSKGLQKFQAQVHVVFAPQREKESEVKA